MTYTFSVQAMCDALWDSGMDDDPVLAGYLDDELEARDGQQFELCAITGDGPDAVARVRWLADDAEDALPIFALPKEATP